MPSKKDSNEVQRGPTQARRDITPNDFPSELNGEFTTLPDQTRANVGTVCGIAVSGGGYFGLSVTDDGGSARLAVRSGSFALDKRFYQLAKFEAALAYCLRKLRELGGE